MAIHDKAEIEHTAPVTPRRKYGECQEPVAIFLHTFSWEISGQKHCRLQ